MIKLIASNIDGTLLTYHGQTAPERTAALIRRLIDKEIYFSAASGRQYSNLRRLFDLISDNIFYAAENVCVCDPKHGTTRIGSHHRLHRRCLERNSPHTLIYTQDHDSSMHLYNPFSTPPHKPITFCMYNQCQMHQAVP